jgi:hypothetical protein
MRFYPKDALASLDADKYIELTQELAKINRHDIAGELSTHPAVFSYYSGLTLTQKGKLDRQNNSLLNLFSFHRMTVSDSNKKAGSKATATYLEDCVNSLPEIQNLRESIQKEEEIYLLLKSICTMLEHKKDMLVQLSANLRTETKLYN